jgi:hypothetical protein
MVKCDFLNGEDSLTTVYRSTALLLLIAGSLMSQGPINTIPSWDGIRFVEPFGAPNAATYGQTITVTPGSAVVSSFGFEIGYCNATVTFRGEVYAWDGAKATGPSLFESEPALTQGISDTFQLVTFNTNALTLAPGNYVLFATTSKNQVTASACEWGSLPSLAAYPAGSHVFMNNGADPSQWTTVAWGTEPFDLAFEVNMTPAPPPTHTTIAPAASPATLLLGFAGVIALGLLGLSRLRTAR